MINLSGIHLAFAGQVLFSGVNLFIDKKDKIGLVGKNGAGKSTLFKLILGKQIPDGGTFSKQPEIRIGHLAQELGTGSDRSVIEEAKMAFSEIQRLQSERDSLEIQLQERSDYETDSYLNLCDKLASLEERLALLGAEQQDKKAGAVLQGLGFLESDFNKALNTFSGGWQMRVELAKILLQQPDLLLLDEPTNHLDIESIQWLEQWLSAYSGAVVLISHDRDFLDAITNRTVEIANRSFYDYPVAYTKYKSQRAERMAQIQSAYDNQQKQIADTEKFIERFRYKATKARQVQSKIKLLDKLERIELDEAEEARLSFFFPEAARAGAIPFQGTGIGKSYGEKQVLADLDFEIERGDRIAFIGKNGTGKSTLAKIIMQLIEFDGELKIGHNIKIGYFAQDNIASLNPNKTAFQTIDDMARGDMRAQVRNLLGAFLFSGEDADKKISVLSGGEKSRLSLAKLLLEEYNVLILDEPTNHLDMQSKDLLKEALLKFNGTYIVVSHDRDFLKGLANKVFEFEPGKVWMYPGGLEDYLHRKSQRNQSTAQKQPSANKVRKVEK